MFGNKNPVCVLKIDKLNSGLEGFMDVEIMDNNTLHASHYHPGHEGLVNFEIIDDREECLSLRASYRRSYDNPHPMIFSTLVYNRSVLFCPKCGFRLTILGLSVLDFKKDTLRVREIIFETVREIIVGENRKRRGITVPS